MQAEEGIYSVSQISGLIQNTLNGQFPRVAIKGEVSGCKIAPSGHVYFNLKDEGAVLNAICWRGTFAKIPFKLTDGLEVIIYGGITTYPGKSAYQVICSDIKQEGLGALMAMLEERKKKLAGEGLFDQSRKRAIPFMPKCVGVITSPTGAVIRDILHRISERFGIHVLVYPVPVQGADSAAAVAGAIEFFNELDKNSPNKPDILIVARGGGSIEDLMPFNEEIVVRAAANSKIPLISAVGHETDTTLIDYASDKRAPTPTAAAEMAVPVKAEIVRYVMDLKTRQYTAINRLFENHSKLMSALKQALISPKQMLQNISQRLDDMLERINNSAAFLLKSKQSELKAIQLPPSLPTNLIKQKEKELQSYKALLESYNYKNVLKRGYSLVHANDGAVIKNAADMKKQSSATIEFYDGKVPVSVNGSEPTQQKAPKKPKAKADTNQENLF